MKASITVELVDQVTAKAKKIKAALEDIQKAAGKQAQDATKAATAKVEAATKAATKAAKNTAKEAVKAPAKEAVAKAKEVAKAPAKEAVAKATAPESPASGKMAPKRPTLDYLRSTGDAPAPLPPAPKKDKSAKPEKAGGQALGIASLAELPAEARAVAAKNTSLVGRALASARTAVASGVTNMLTERLSEMATNAVTSRLAAVFDPMRAQLEQMKTDFPAFAPIIERVQGHFEAFAATATAFAGNMAGNLAGKVASRIGMMAASMIGLPGIAVVAGLAVMANWSTVKEKMAGLFAKLPEPVQNAMRRVGAVLSRTYLGDVARGFDGVASYVEKVFDAAVNGGEQRWSKLKELLVDNPVSWVSGAWDGLKSYFSSLWDSIKANPREALANMASSVVSYFKAIPSHLTGVSISIIEAITGADLSAVRAAAQRVIDAFWEIPGKMLDLGRQIAAKIGEGDFSGAARLAADSFAEGLRNILSLIGNLGSEIVAKFKDISLVSAGLAMIDSLWAGMKAGLDAIVGRVRDKLNDIKASISGSLGSSGPGPAAAGKIVGGAAGGALGARAKGGPVSAGTPYIVGEEGQELFVPDQSGRIIDASQTRRMMSPVNLPTSAPAPSLYGGGDGVAGGGMRATVEGNKVNSTSMSNTFHITLPHAKADDPEDFARKMWAELERSMRGLMHDGVSG